MNLIDLASRIFVANPGTRAGSETDSAQDLIRILVFIWLMVLTGLVGLSIPAFAHVAQGRYVDALVAVGTGAFLSGAATAAGSFIGFLFGVPRAGHSVTQESTETARAEHLIVIAVTMTKSITLIARASHRDTRHNDTSIQLGPGLRARGDQARRSARSSCRPPDTCQFCRAPLTSSASIRPVRVDLGYQQCQRCRRQKTRLRVAVEEIQLGPVKGARVLLADDHTLILGAFEKLLARGMRDRRTGVRWTRPGRRRRGAQAGRDRPGHLDAAIERPRGRASNQAVAPNVKLVFLTMNEDRIWRPRHSVSGASAYLLKRSAASELPMPAVKSCRRRSYVTPLSDGRPGGIAVARGHAHALPS